MILNKIKQDIKSAMISKNTELRDFLKVVVGEVERQEDTVTDELMIRILKKLHKNAELCNNNWEQEILSSYLPKVMSDEDIEKIISILITENNFTAKDIGKLMGKIKEYEGIPMKNASVIAKKLLI